MREDRAFLEAIFESPEDWALRLVYADWLEERGDPRGELLRLRTELHARAPTDSRRPSLLARDRELSAGCDEEWLVLLERADWKLRYRALEPTGRHRDRWRLPEQAAISEAIRALESERRLRLPRSYKGYAHVFGWGEMARYFRICVPCVSDDYGDLLAFNRKAQTGEGYCWAGDPDWLKHLVFLALTIGGEAVVWDTTAVTDPVAHEYQICWLDRTDEVYRTASSFPQFIDDVCLKVFAEEGTETPQEFLPY